MPAELDQRFAGLPVSERGELVLIAAESHKSRRRGLAKLDALHPDHALHIPSTPSVHTVGMRFKLDLIWLDKAGHVIRVDREIPPWRMKFCRGARSVIETCAGRADAFLAAGFAAPAPARETPRP